MRKLVLATSVAVFSLSASAHAADMEYEQQLGLIVSGVVDQWMGAQFNSGPLVDGSGLTGDDTLFTTGGEGLLSLPLGENLSIQSDIKYETNSASFGSTNSNVFGPRYSYQYAAHLSWRDPSAGLFGIFGGMGTADFNLGPNAGPPLGSGLDTDFRFLGGEAQFYMNNITFYAQGGYVDFSSEFDGLGGQAPVPTVGLDDGFFVRGVMRWFPTSYSRLQLEGTYLNADFNSFSAIGAPALSAGDMEAFSVKARYDFTLASMPIIGDLPLFLAYRGTFRDNCAFSTQAGSFDVDDHTFMVGSSYSFNGDRLTIDRQGATLDTPDFNYSCFAVGGTADSDRRLKTDVAELGTTADGVKLYSWKYNSDPVTTWVGVMAQDLVETHPEALVVGADGYYRVRYDTLGVQMMTLEQWEARHL
jgi:hypothetical protein